ncbi:MAG TPA: NAD(P)-binding domain-containing protein, partial [Thermoguttaceae bacterium]|nr:NAD(P)-binding domain-containing protein [Thermoguttaceae bacterium]
MAVMEIEPGKTRIGWIGTGVMGSSMCGHLLGAGFSTAVYNRTREKAERLLGRGALWAMSPKEVAETSD